MKVVKFFKNKFPKKIIFSRIIKINWGLTIKGWGDMNMEKFLNNNKN